MQDNNTIVFNKGYEEGKNWQKEKDKANYDKLVECLRELINEYGIFADVPENYKGLNGYPGDENPRTLAMIKAKELLQNLTEQP